MLPVVYAAPFALISLTAFLACILIDRWRGYALMGLALPIIFGACSLFGALLIMLPVEFMLESMRLPLPAATIKAVLVVSMMATYFLCGSAGIYFGWRWLAWLQTRPRSDQSQHKPTGPLP